VAPVTRIEGLEGGFEANTAGFYFLVVIEKSADAKISSLLICPEVGLSLLS